MDRRTTLSTVVVLAVTVALITLLIVRQADTGSDEAVTDPPSLPDPDLDADPGTDSDPDPDVDPDPDADSPQTLEEFVTEAIAFVEEVRGMAFLTDPVVVALAEDDFVARVDGDLEAQFAEDPGLVEEFTAVYRAFGLIRPDERIDEVYRAFGAAGILGFYDPETDELVVRQVDELSLLTKSTIVHELVHAFDDQHFDLDRPEYDDLTDEIPWTFTALAEGSASYVESLWEDTLSRSQRADLLQEELSFGDPGIFDRFEFAFLLLELSPYEAGEQFVQRIVEADGFDRLGELFAAPPPTSEQVIDPAAFRSGELGVGLAVPPADGTVVSDGIGGQVLLESLFLGEGVDFGDAAEGWGDDRYVVWTEGATSCLRWDLRADTDPDLAELEEALEGWIAGRGGVVSRTDPATVRVERCA